MEVLALAVMAAANIVCFTVGARVGQAVSKGEPVELPTLNPAQVWREHREKKEARAEQDRLDTILRNIENYNGTDYAQEDVP